MDWNVQFDTRAAQILAATAVLTLVTLPVALKAHLRAADLPRLRACGPLGQLLARHGEDHDMAELGRAHAGLPDDLLNFHYDPVACAVAAGWNGATIEERRLQPVLDGEVLRFQPDQGGRPMSVVVDLDGAGFTETWLGPSSWPKEGHHRAEPSDPGQTLPDAALERVSRIGSRVELRASVQVEAGREQAIRDHRRRMGSVGAAAALDQAPAWRPLA